MFKTVLLFATLVPNAFPSAEASTASPSTTAAVASQANPKNLTPAEPEKHAKPRKVVSINWTGIGLGVGLSAAYLNASIPAYEAGGDRRESFARIGAIPTFGVLGLVAGIGVGSIFTSGRSSNWGPPLIGGLVGGILGAVYGSMISSDISQNRNSYYATQVVPATFIFAFGYGIPGL